MKHIPYSFMPEWLFFWLVRRKLYQRWIKQMKPRADELIESYKQELADVKREITDS